MARSVSNEPNPSSRDSAPVVSDVDRGGAIHASRARSLKLFGVMIAGCICLGFLTWAIFPGTSTVSPHRGPRLQADQQDSEVTQQATLTLPTEPEVIDMPKLQSEMIAEAKRLELFYPKSAQSLDLAASVYFDLNQLENAERLWQSCLALQPSQADYYISYGEFLQNQERSEEAIEVILSAHERKIETAGTYHVLASAYERSGELEKAREVSAEVTRRFPEFGASWLLTGKIQSQLGDLPEAESSLRRALELEQTKEDVWPVLATVLARQGKRDEATELRKQLKQLLDSATADDNSSRTQPFQRKFENSLRDRAARLFFNSASIEKQAWNLGESLRMALRSLQLKPDNPPTLVYIAEQLVESNQVADAMAVYERLTQIQPENLLHFNNLAGLAFREKNLPLAEKTLEAGLKAHPDQVALQIPLAKVYIGQKKALEARALVQEVLKSQPNPEAMMVFGASYELVGDMEQANRAYEQARQMPPLPSPARK